jgi:uncharacterized protein (DUF952 family)
MLLHLMSGADWSAVQRLGTIAPASLESEGFVHCCGDDGQLLAVANRFYRGLDDEVAVLEIDAAELVSEVRWEAPAHPDGSPAADDEPEFPHVYGPIPVGAVRSVRWLIRATAGGYAAIGPRTVTPTAAASAPRNPPA